MSLIELDLRFQPAAPPSAVSQFLKAAHERIDLFLDRRRDRPVPGFVASDFELVYAALAATLASHLPAGRCFCEWGSGFGVVASLAATLDFDSCGIEIEPELVEEARRLARDFGIDVDFVQGSFIPDGGDVHLEQFGELHWLTATGKSAYESLEMEADDFDVVFAYPWPGEEQAVFDLFERYAAAGTLLLTYHGSEELRVQRKAARRRRLW